MPSNRARTSGFSLLELIIVLMVMVSLLAIAWPNLQRPLRRTTLSEAAQTLRSAIDDSRYQAITTGTPVFVQLQQGEGSVRAGSFNGFMNDEAELGSMGSTLQPATIKPATINPSSNRSLQAGPPVEAIRTWTLPPSVVISDVRWTLEPPAEEEFGLGETSTDSDSAVAEVQSDAMLASGLDQAGGFNGAAGGQTWWLPLVATGQGRDAAIVLLDTSIDEEITVTFASATGALEIVK
jgi:prepilin-type N-terminal cleavage/methylation domain-containing protein